MGEGAQEEGVGAPWAFLGSLLSSPLAWLVTLGPRVAWPSVGISDLADGKSGQGGVPTPTQSGWDSSLNCSVPEHL